VPKLTITRLAVATTLLAGLGATAAGAAEFYVGEPVVRQNLQIVPNYLTGIMMSRMQGEPMGADVVHLEADVHATAKETHGFAEDAWIPYLTIHYTLTRQGTPFRATGTLRPMTAGDGPHYANNVKMAGPGTYHLVYVIDPPSANGFLRHVDKATGVPGWWKPITASWTFTYPSRSK